ncbi:MAG: BTAD domain-containing putative transcriptional regulator, partial [Haloechinothrix sp.]
MRLLGPFSVRRDGQEIEPTAFGGRLPQTLLRLLATRRGSVVARDVLVDALWPEHPPADPMANLNVLASRVRKATGAPWLVTAAGGGYLMPARQDCVIDAEQFLAEVKAGCALLAADRHAEAITALETALTRWIGEPLAEDRYADWAQPYRRMLDQERHRALQDAAASALVLGDGARALRWAEQAVTAEPLREAAALLRIRALAACGDPAGAADAYFAFRRLLADETGLEPSPAAAALHQRLLRGELGAPRHRPAARQKPAAPSLSELPFVGRDQELGIILRHVQLSGTVLLAGVSGVGKSRLLSEVARRAVRPVLSARAFRAERDEAWSLARHLLRECLAADVSAVAELPERIVFALADVLPDLEEIRRLPSLMIEADSRRALMIEGALRLVGASRGRPLVLIDDLQWADASSLGLLDRIRARLPQVGMVLAYRPEELPPEGPLPELLAHSEATSVLTVEPLDADAIGHLVTDDAIVAGLVDGTDRTPMAIVEVIRALAGRGALARRDDGRWAPTAPGVELLVKEVARAGQERAIQRRAADLSVEARELLRLLALLGRETPARVLADVLGRVQLEVLDKLDDLAHAGVARLGERGWATAHDLVAESVVAGLDRPTRGVLHGMLARALIADDAEHAEVARHLAGAGDADAAARAYAAAAQDGLDRFANQEARQLASAGLALKPKAAVRAQLLEVRAESNARAGDLR